MKLAYLFLLMLVSIPAHSQTNLLDGEGLYEGTNVMPSLHYEAGMAALNAIRPVNGKTALLCTGMSNARLEWGESGHLRNRFAWKAEGHPNVGPYFQAPGGCVSSMSSEMWSDPSHSVYDRADSEIGLPWSGTDAVSPDQVVAATHKLAFQHPERSYSPGESHVSALARAAADTARAIRIHYPNVQIVWFWSRTYGGFATNSLNPEPYAFEGGLAVKRLVLGQAEQRETGFVDPELGDLLTDMPWIGWGPYVWAPQYPGRSDGLFYERSDFTSDGIHPTPSGQRKVSDEILRWCLADVMCSRLHSGDLGSGEPPPPPPPPAEPPEECAPWL